MESTRPPQNLVVLIDGTFASLDPDHRSSIGRLYAALSGWWGPIDTPMKVRYEPGQQWETWRTISRLAAGSELESRILGAYAWIAQHWRPGDPLFLFGYSRGAFAIRSLAGMIGRIGLLRPSAVSDQTLARVWQLYSQGCGEDDLAGFRRAHCHDHVPIRMIGTFDTVVALGIRLPLLWMLAEPRFRFHDHELGTHVEHAAQALALDETRAAFAPLLWSSGERQATTGKAVKNRRDSRGGQDDMPAPQGDPRIRQMWFRGVHPDIGGQLSGAEYARPLANIPLVWMMEQAEEAGLPLPGGWRERLPRDATAPSVGSWRHWGKAFLARAPRVAGHDPSESLHETVPFPYPGPALLVGSLSDFARDRLRLRRPLAKSPGMEADKDAAVNSAMNQAGGTAEPPVAGVRKPRRKKAAPAKQNPSPTVDVRDG